MWQKHFVMLLTAYFSHVLWSAKVPRQGLKQGQKCAFHEEALFYYHQQKHFLVFAFFFLLKEIKLTLSAENQQRTKYTVYSILLE